MRTVRSLRVRLALGGVVLACLVLVWFHEDRAKGGAALPSFSRDSARLSAEPVYESAEAPRSRSSLRVRIIAAKQRKPLQNARVTLVRAHSPSVSPRVLRSSREGLVGFTGLSPGAYGVRVEHPIFATAEREVQLADGPLELELELALGGRLKGQVIDSGGKPIAGARLSVNRQGSVEQIREATTGMGGHFELQGLPLDDLTVRATAVRYRPLSRAIRFQKNGDQEALRLLLQLGQRISGRVIDQDGRAVMGAQVGSSDSNNALVSTDQNGAFELLGLGDTPVQLFALAGGFAPARLAGVRPGTEGVELGLTRPAQLQGRIESATGGDLLLSLCHEDPYFRHEVCVSRLSYQSGATSYRFDSVPPGDYELVVEVEGQKPQRFRLTLEAGAIAEGPSLAWPAG